MKLLMTSLLTCLLVTATARAAEFEWKGVGKIKADLPAGWTSESLLGKSNELKIRVAADGGKKAEILLTLFDVPQGPREKAELKKTLGMSVANFLPNFVEGKVEIRDIDMPHGFGVYTQLTDKSLVGKSVGPSEFRVMRSAHVYVEPKVMGVITILFDDPAQAEVEQLMKIVQSLSVERTP